LAQNIRVHPKAKRAGNHPTGEVVQKGGTKVAWGGNPEKEETMKTLHTHTHTQEGSHTGGKWPVGNQYQAPRSGAVLNRGGGTLMTAYVAGEKRENLVPCLNGLFTTAKRGGESLRQRGGKWDSKNEAGGTVQPCDDQS